jgi:transposase
MLAWTNSFSPSAAPERSGSRASSRFATAPIRAGLAQIRAVADAAHIESVRLIVEPTGVYHKLLLRLACEARFEPCLVNAEHVAKMRAVVFGDPGKTDLRDPAAIAGVATQGRVIREREFPENFALLRGWARIYQDAEDAMIEAKSRIHAALKLFFPDFDFSTDFLYGPSGRALIRCFGLNPHRIAQLAPSRILARLRPHCRILKSSIARLCDQAQASASSTPSGCRNELAERILAMAFEDLEHHEQRRELARARLATLYEAARAEDPRLPPPLAKVVSITTLARIVAETGPLSDFASWRQLLRHAGLNLCERQSGRYLGLTKIARRGRPQLRRVPNIMALPLVRRGQLFGAWYQQKTTTEKMPGKKAMTAVSRKLVKMLWGWSRSAEAFDPLRVFHCEAEFRRAA